MITGLAASRYRDRHRRLDEHHSNLNRVWMAISGGRAWPDNVEWQVLHSAAHLAEFDPPAEVVPDARTLRVEIAFPMPAVSLTELEPARFGRLCERIRGQDLVFAHTEWRVLRGRLTAGAREPGRTRRAHPTTLLVAT